MSFSPICLFVYKRLELTRHTVENLQRNYLASQSDIYIFCEAARNESEREEVEKVRRFVQQISGFRSIDIIMNDVNSGLASSIVTGVSSLLECSDRVVVVEDDLITTPNFLNFMNSALDYYQNDNRIQSISGYSFALPCVQGDVYFQSRPSSWGWATWRDRWNNGIFDNEYLKKKIESEKDFALNFRRQCGDDLPRMLRRSLDDEIDSWAVKWMYNHYQSNRLAVYPTHSLVINNGYADDDATHCKGINVYRSTMSSGTTSVFRFEKGREPTKLEREQFLRYFSFTYKLQKRLKLLLSTEGRKTLFEEVKLRFRGEI